MTRSMLLRIALTVGAGSLAARATLWLLAPARTCVVLDDVRSGFTCPNRFGVSLHSAVILALTLLVAGAVAFLVWRSTARIGRAHP